MSTKNVNKLTEWFQQAQHEIVSLVAACPDTHWQMFCTGENETLAALVNHIALGYSLEIDLLQFALGDADCPVVYLSQQDLDQLHAKSSRLYASQPKRETLGILVQNGAEAADFMGSLSDEDLKKAVSTPLLDRWYGKPPTMERVVMDFLIGHHAMHIESLKKLLIQAKLAQISRKG